MSRLARIIHNFKQLMNKYVPLWYTIILCILSVIGWELGGML